MSKFTIILPEAGLDDRVKEAGRLIEEHGIADVITIDVDAKGLCTESASDSVSQQIGKALDSNKRPWLHENDPLSRGLSMLALGEGSILIAGAVRPTAEVIVGGIKLVGVVEGSKTVSSFFRMIPPSSEAGALYFADCGVVPNPSAEQLKDIALATASSVSKLGDTPRVAFLSYASGNSAGGPDVDKVSEAVELLSAENPNFVFDGPLQFDAAFLSDIATSKKPNSPMAEQPANVFIFPDLNSGNIGYKIAQRLGNMQAIGPILQGLRLPVYDLSRGCSVEDIVKMAETAVQLAE